MTEKIALTDRRLELGVIGATRGRVGDGGVGVPPRGCARRRRCSAA